ncbi:MAG: hypothetical protein ACLUEQ_11285 [Cloacibacillus evryensis]
MRYARLHHDNRHQRRDRRSRSLAEIKTASAKSKGVEAPSSLINDVLDMSKITKGRWSCAKILRPGGDGARHRAVSPTRRRGGAGQTGVL